MISKEQKLVKINNNFMVDFTRQLGRGNFGNVYVGLKVDTDQLIAVKLVPYVKMQEYPELSEREISVMDALKQYNHPNIMGFYGSTYVKHRGLYVYLQKCQKNLKELIQKQQKLSELTVLKFFQQLIHGLNFLHSKKYIHRDLKPENILIDDQDNLKIADFGLAKLNQVQNTEGTGTPLYRAPEVLTGAYDFKCDVWSAGIILHEMLTGKYLFQGIRNFQDLSKRMKSLSNKQFDFRLPKEIDPVWKDILRQMLEYQQSKRISVGDILKNLASVAGTLEKHINIKYANIGIRTQQMKQGTTITQTVSPYQQRKRRYQNVQIEQAQHLFEEHESFKNLNAYRKYLSYFTIKVKMYSKIKIYALDNQLVIRFENPRIFGYGLTYLVLAIELLKIQVILSSIIERRIELPSNRLLEISYFQAFHQQQFKKLSFDTQKRLQAEKKQILIWLKDKLLGKLEEYRKRPQLKEIVESQFKGIYKIAKIIYKGDMRQLNIENLKREYENLLKSNWMRMSLAELEKVTDKRLRSYFNLYLMMHLDEMLLDQNFQSTEYLINRKNAIQNLRREQMLQHLRNWID